MRFAFAEYYVTVWVWVKEAQIHGHENSKKCAS
jgi:hypothetical protein